ncbi:DoxX family protein [Aureisphaera galaxeae]|uniref:DoxX family protein n=1 Tax=Aureisphaera galaxeae TaxID=1538023 RepID=UPI002350915B|nr:DoxX family protein [Aureisphaera galaxeae]MDC8005898.1 DoxX family protein [Aureisphaera galaxeae]
MKKGQTIISWILRILIAIAFLLASSGKLMAHEAVVQMFENWGYPKGFHLLIGVLELLLAVLLLIPKTLKLSLIGLAILMAGAIITHIVNDPLAEVIRPLVFLVLLTIVYYLNFLPKSPVLEG